VKVFLGELFPPEAEAQLLEIFLQSCYYQFMRIEFNKRLKGIPLQEAAHGRKLLKHLLFRGHR